MIKKCRKGDGKAGKPWCLYTKDGSRLLGAHKSQEDCYKQEAAIKAHGSMVATLDAVAEALEHRGDARLASAVDVMAHSVHAKQVMVGPKFVDKVNRVLVQLGFGNRTAFHSPNEVYERLISGLKLFDLSTNLTVADLFKTPHGSKAFSIVFPKPKWKSDLVQNVILVLRWEAIKGKPGYFTLIARLQVPKVRAEVDEGNGSLADEQERVRQEQLDRTGFDEIMERDFEVADKIYQERIPHFNWTDL